MGEVMLRSRGPADPVQVWRRYAEPRLWSTWSPQVRGVDCPLPRIQVGARGEVRGPLGLRVPFTVDAVDEAGGTWSWTVRVILRGRVLVRVGLDHGVEARGGGAAGTATWLRLRGPWPVIVGYAPVARVALGRLTR